MALHDARNTNRTAARVPTDPREQWQVTFDSTHLTPTVADGTAYVVTPDGSTLSAGTLHALDAASGDERWTESPPNARAFYGTPAVDDGTVVYATVAGEDLRDPRLHARDVEAGDERWQVDMPAPAGVSPTVAGGAVVVAGGGSEDGGWVGSFETGSGDRSWGTDLGPNTFGPVATDGDTVVAVTIAMTVVALDAGSGERAWTRFDGGGEAVRGRVVPPAVGDGRVFVVRHEGGAGESTVYALDSTSAGETAWQRTVPGRLPGSGMPAPVLGLADERVVCLTVEGRTDPTARLVALDRASGEQQWTYTVDVDGEQATGWLTLAADSALFVTDGRLHVVSLDGERRWRRDVGAAGGFAKPVVADGRVFVRVPGASDRGSTLAALA